MLICGECKQPFTNIISCSTYVYSTHLMDTICCMHAKVFVQLYVVMNVAWKREHQERARDDAEVV